MSLLSFLGLRRPFYNRTRLTLADILHRTVVSGLAALSVYGLFLGYMVHKETLAKGQGTWPYFIEAPRIMTPPRKLMAKREAEVKERGLAQAAEEARERVLAEAAQSALNPRAS
ncbi:hypothetical protein J3A83DRAFT_4367994 [Scleroderma citrinum]